MLSKLWPICDERCVFIRVQDPEALENAQGIFSEAALEKEGNQRSKKNEEFASRQLSKNKIIKTFFIVLLQFY